MEIGEKIRQERKRNGLIQEELASQIGVSLKTLQRWEAGKSSPRIKDIKKISKILGVSVDFLTEAPKNLSLDKILQNVLDANSIYVNKEEPQTPKGIQPPEKDLGLGYWGSVVDNAKLLARCADEQELSLVRVLLKTALDAVTGTRGATGKQAPVEVHHNNINGRDFNFAAQA